MACNKVEKHSINVQTEDISQDEEFQSEIQSLYSYNWPIWRGPDQDGICKETDWDPNALANGPNFIWKKKIGRGYSAVSDKLILLSERGRLAVAYVTPVGYFEISSCQLGEDFWFTPPTFCRKKLYVRNRKGDLLCIDFSKQDE